MTPLTRTLVPIALILLVACGGVSEARFNALEAQVKQLQSSEPTETTESGGADFEQRIADVEKSSTEATESLNKAVEALQDQLAKLASADAETSAAAGPSPDEADAWADADAILGVPTEPIKANGDVFEVSKRYLFRELRSMAITGKGPKFKAGPKGVVVRGFKPDSMFDKLGLNNGDVILTVNGAATATIEALAAELKKGKNPVELGLERKRKPLTITFKVVD